MIKYNPKEVVASLLKSGYEKEDRKKIYNAIRRIIILSKNMEIKKTMHERCSVLNEIFRLKAKYCLTRIEGIEWKGI